MNFDTNRNSIIRGIVTALAVINMIIIEFGGNEIAISDSRIYLVGSALALIVTAFLAWYKHNATTPLGCLVRRMYDLAKKHGYQEIYEVVIVALEDFVGEEGEE